MALHLTLHRAEHIETGWLFGDVLAINWVLLDGVPVGAIRSQFAKDEHFGRVIDFRAERLSWTLEEDFLRAMTEPSRTALQIHLFQENVAHGAAARWFCCAPSPDEAHGSELALGCTDPIPLIQLLDGRPKALGVSTGGLIFIEMGLVVYAPPPTVV